MTQKTISSNWTKPMLILMTLCWIVLPIVLYLSSGGKIKIEGSQFAAVIIYVIYVGVTIYLALSLARVTVSNDTITYKKIFGNEKSYPFDKIGYPKSFRYGRLKFTSVKMSEKNGSESSFLILNNNAMLSGESIDAEATLTELRRSGAKN